MKRNIVKLASKMARNGDWLINSGADLMLRNLILPKTVFTATYWVEIEEEFVEHP